MNTTAARTADIFTTFERNDEWEGFGYIGGRRNAADLSDPEATVDPARIAAVDAYVLDVAASRNWTDAQLFAWANSKAGRHFADATLFSDLPVADAITTTYRWSLI